MNKNNLIQPSEKSMELSFGVTGGSRTYNCGDDCGGLDSYTRGFEDGLKAAKLQFKDTTDVQPEKPGRYLVVINSPVTGGQDVSLCDWLIETQQEDIYEIPVGSIWVDEHGIDISDYVIAWTEIPKYK